MAKYKTKPCEIEAVKWDGLNIKEIKAFVGDSFEYNAAKLSVTIHTLEGNMRADVGDYIIKGLRGEFYPCKPDVFEKKYELLKGE